MSKKITKGCVIEGITSGVLRKVKTDQEVYMYSINGGWKVLDKQMSDKQIKEHNKSLGYE